jgi:hypothetical protein
LTEASVIRITDKSFRYVPSYETDLKKSFKRIEQATRAGVAQTARKEAAKEKTPLTTIAWRGSRKS